MTKTLREEEAEAFDEGVAAFKAGRIGWDHNPYRGRGYFMRDPERAGAWDAGQECAEAERDALKENYKLPEA